MYKDINIRRATIDDVESIWYIEQVSFPNPWSQEAFIGELTNNNFAHYFVIEIKEKIIAYVGMWIILDESHITNIAVLPEARGMKVGELLMRHIMSYAKGFNVIRMTLEVRVSNEVARNLYIKLGFKEQGIRKNYYNDGGIMEDAIIMWVNL